ncbi:ABC transporter permease [Pseudofrankia saprophytica]|uniref:ABC transporter permease n=1 Tax=Pseudofrankia saprophytica TaxID=298655 RepID=UPI000234BD25|nr:ABC transporter permease subunit [Pseudofrankia saprophytica]
MTRRWGRTASGLAGTVVVLAVWQLLGSVLVGRDSGLPGPWQVARQFGSDGLSLYANSARATLGAAAQGWLWGNLLAVAAAMLALVVPPVERVLLQIGVVSYCLPIVAIGPVFAIVFSSGTSRIVLAGMAVFFTTLINLATGLRGVDRTWLAVVSASGGGRVATLRKVRLRAGLPSLFLGLQIAAPAALLGAIIGEYIGADDGLGVLMINSQQGFNVERTWATAVTATVVAGVLYWLIGFAGRRLLPWAGELNVRDVQASTASTSGRHRGLAARAVGSVGTTVASFVAVLAIWWLFLVAFGVSSFIGKTPPQVWEYLTGKDAPIGDILGQAGTTAKDALIGLAGGAGVAVVVAVAFYLWPVVERSLIGVALAMRSIPLVAMTPVIVLIFGRGLLGVTVIAGTVTFFPTLVNVGDALATSSRDATAMMRALGASRWQTLRKVQAPTALPALFVSLRTAAPLAITGALLAEWLATGQGLGYGTVQALVQSDYLTLWSEVVVVTCLSAVLYIGIGLLEKAVMLRFNGQPAATAASEPARAAVPGTLVGATGGARA